MLSKTHSLPFPFLFSLSKCCHPKRQPVVLSAVEGPALTAILTERSEWRDLLHSLTFHRKRNGKTLMLTKTHSLPFPFLFSLSKRWHHGCSSVVLSERSEWRDLLHSLTLSSKEEWKNAHANKNAFAAFSIPLSLSNVVAMDALLSPRASVERSDGRGRFLDSSPSDLRSE